MQAIYNLSSFVLQTNVIAFDFELPRLRTMALAGTFLFLVAMPVPEQENAVMAPLGLEDSHQDLSLPEVVQHLRARLPAANKGDAYRLARTIVHAAERHQISPALILSVIETESSFRYAIVSKAGAIGLMQVKPRTAEEVARRYHLRYNGAADLENPLRNVEIGVAYLAYLRGRFGQSLHYLAAYNMGPTSLRARINRGDYELGAVQGYVEKIHGRTRALRTKAAYGGPENQRLAKLAALSI